MHSPSVFRSAFPRALTAAPLLCGLLSTLSVDALSAQEARAELAAPQAPRVLTHSTTLPLLGVTVTETKTVSLDSGDVVYTAVDQRGNPVDLDALVREETRLRLAIPAAKLEPALTTILKAQPDAAHRVACWLAYDDEALEREAARLTDQLSEDATPAQLEAAEAAMGKFAMEQIGKSNARTAARLRALNVDVRYVSTTAPALFIDATAAQAQQIAALADIDTLYLEAEGHDTNSSANSTHRATTTYNKGWRGNGLRVAVLENNGIDPNCPHLNVTQWFNAGSPNPDDHVHGTAGCIASRLASRRGGAPNVALYSANAASYSDTDITRAADWIATRNIEATNMSYGGTYSGSLRYKDRYFDYQSRIFQDSYVASAGNSGNYVGSPGTAWNCISVGAFSDKDNGSWSGDTISSFSAYINPTTGCEKPNLAGVGELVDTIGMGPDWLRDNYAGTSFSAPFTTAALAVTMKRDASAKTPEAAMAAMMATAWHNIEGSARLSGKDGAGGLHQRAAANCGNNNRIRWVRLDKGSFNNNGYYTYNISLNANDRTRICIAWAANANSSYTSTVLNADLDIAIYKGSRKTSGTRLASSSSLKNNFEIVQFTPSSGGTHTIRINDRRFAGSSERVGIAWSQRNRDQGN